MDVNAYLKRIGLTKIEKPSLSWLSCLQTNHILSVPFETLSIHRDDETVSLESDLLFEKIVERRRGGFCYELNGLFAELLEAVGFEVTRISAKVYSEAKDEFGPEFDHMALLVHLDKKYLVDVGFGNQLRIPLVMPNGDAEDAEGRFRIVRNLHGIDDYMYEKMEDGQWLPKYRFSSMPRDITEFAPMCHWQQTSPDSHFTVQPLCSQATETGRKTLVPKRFIVTDLNQTEATPVRSTEDYNKLLKEHFGIDL